MAPANKALVPLREYLTMTPRERGYVVYLQADLPGSPLRDCKQNPFPEGSIEYNWWNEGQKQAMADVQDGGQ